MFTPPFTRWLCLALLLTQSPAMASVEDERRELAAINQQLTRLEFLIQRAEQAADYRYSRHMDYGLLRSELSIISSGIDAYLTPSRLTPVPIAPITGDYLISAHP
ncbi:MAG: hypothetical protein COC24_018265 [Alphaproteobacteria bacterium]|nr:hypothetical protein [Alphaproteobacteria bacterium]